MSSLIREKLTPVNGCMPDSGDAFAFLTYGFRNGTFATSPDGFDLNDDDADGILFTTA